MHTFRVSAIELIGFDKGRWSELSLDEGLDVAVVALMHWLLVERVLPHHLHDEFINLVDRLSALAAQH